MAVSVHDLSPRLDIHHQLLYAHEPFSPGNRRVALSLTQIIHAKPSGSKQAQGQHNAFFCPRAYIRRCIVASLEHSPRGLFTSLVVPDSRDITFVAARQECYFQSPDSILSSSTTKVQVLIKTIATESTGEEA
jgi:hypothetical protein